MSNQAKFTPGPWSYWIDPKTRQGHIYVADNFKIHDLFNGTVEAMPVVEANARLMAAAPDADRILRVLLDYLDNGSGSGAPNVPFDALMPEDGYDGAADDQTLGTAILRYFAKVDGK